MATVKVKGLDKLLKQFDQFGEQAKRVAATEVKDGADEIAQIARNNAPKNIGKLIQGIQPNRKSNLFFEVVAKEPYSGFVEFGTGTKVSVPSELKDVAQSIRNNKNDDNKTGLEAIQDYCRQKGIDESFAFVIFMKILKVGIRPQPFLWPAFKQGSANTVKRLEEKLKQEVNKFNNAR